MAVALDQNLGNAHGFSVGAISLPAAASVPAGELTVVCGGVTDLVTQTITDIAGNTYSVAEHGANTWDVLIAASQMGMGLSAGQTIKDSLSASRSCFLAAASFTNAGGGAASSYGGAAAGGNSTTATVTSGQSVTAGDLAVMVVVGNHPTSAPSQPTNWGTITSQVPSSGFFAMFYIVPGSNGVLSPSSSVSSGAGVRWSAAIVAFPASSSTPGGGGGGGGLAHPVRMVV